MEGLPLIGLLVGAFAVTAVARRVNVSAPLLLVVVGLAASFVPGIPDYAIDPDLILLLVLPPLLYSAALDSSYLRIRDNVRTIGLLAVGLVLVTTAVVGLAAWWLVPGLPLTSALVLGAVVAPPDAVAATAVGRRLGLPRRIMTILGGESLVNDATALTAYKVAVALVMGASYSILQGLGVFALAAGGGALIGWALGWLVHRVRLLLGDGVLESALGLLVPFIGYWVAEEAHASGVLAVVMAGLYLGHRGHQADPVARLQDQAVWRAVDTLLESFVFALIGLQLREVTAAIDSGLGRLTLVGLVLLLVAVVVRIVWVFPTTYLPRRLSARLRARDPSPAWQVPAVISWAGMRGVVSLAAAAAIPLATDAGAPFPGRDEIVYLAFLVTVGTLLLQGMTLPAVIRRLAVRGREDYTDALAEAQAQHDAARAASARLDELDDGDPLAERAVAKLRASLEARTNAAWERLGGPDSGATPSEVYRRLRRELLLAEREVFLSYRDARRIDDEVFRRIQRELDLEEVMLERE
ncbi:Na+/H+ antiporter [Geodermatophilus sp. URMC 64]